MPLLSVRGFIADEWRKLDAEEEPPALGDVIVAWERLAREWESLVKHDGRLGVVFPNNEQTEALSLYRSRLGLIVLAFPSFTDGRAYSIARQLRLDGYRGELRASGDVLPDQLQFMVQVGFDSFEVGDRFAEGQWQRAVVQMSLTYQHGLAAPAPHPAAAVWKLR
ncbi:MAG: DUF934 domain-containing protein, partial [Pseudomonadota bacterium]|nr:DUF934 domain-containing protein [Pseudomonadota bacterium]